MKTKVVLFDLDGTLLPMDQETFVKAYFGLMAKKLEPFGYERNAFVKAIYIGMEAMIKNDGSKTNEQACWDAFAGVSGEGVKEHMPVFDEYYRVEFQQVKDVCGYNPKAAETIAKIKEMGYRVALATNPLFPKYATQSRIRWAGMQPEDFELITTYEESRHCKPNIEYYKDVARALGVEPEECLMVGNDVTEDMVAKELGMKVFLLPADLINKENKDISEYPHGDFADLLAYIESL